MQPFKTPVGGWVGLIGWLVACWWLVLDEADWMLGCWRWLVGRYAANGGECSRFLSWAYIKFRNQLYENHARTKQMTECGPCVWHVYCISTGIHFPTANDDMV